jgi:hypothetical protein
MLAEVINLRHIFALVEVEMQIVVALSPVLHNAQIIERAIDSAQ